MKANTVLGAVALCVASLMLGFTISAKRNEPTDSHARSETRKTIRSDSPKQTGAELAPEQQSPTRDESDATAPRLIGSYRYKTSHSTDELKSLAAALAEHEAQMNVLSAGRQITIQERPLYEDSTPQGSSINAGSGAFSQSPPACSCNGNDVILQTDDDGLLWATATVHIEQGYESETPPGSRGTAPNNEVFYYYQEDPAKYNGDFVWRQDNRGQNGR